MSETDYETYREWTASLRSDYPNGGKIESVMLLTNPPRNQYHAYVNGRRVSSWTEPPKYNEFKSDW